MTFNVPPPGAVQPMNLGLIGSAGVIFKRKFRWTMEIEYCLNGSNQFVDKSIVKVGARPSVDIEETEINYLHGRMWIPGKATWQEMTVTYYDIAGDLGGAAAGTNSLLGWIASIYDFIVDPTNLFMGSQTGDYQGIATLYLYDGCGTAIEGWQLQNVWPKAINFGELDMASSDECTIELTLRYSQVAYSNYCNPGISKCPCSTCAGS